MKELFTYIFKCEIWDEVIKNHKIVCHTINASDFTEAVRFLEDWYGNELIMFEVFGMELTLVPISEEQYENLKKEF
ncbi:hypothetical protein IJD44_00885 [bacterium]|nr:hypothetical protein [bacterium]